MSTCKNCKWWGVDICDFPDTIHAEKNQNTVMLIEVEADDDQGLRAFLRTGPDFGCIHFKEK